MRKSFKKGVLATLLAVTVLTTSCYGPFQATRNLWKWNADVSTNKWAQEGMFLVLAIIPVYGLFMLGDAIIFNSIVFWGGSNPISPSVMNDTSGSLDNVAAAYGLNYSAAGTPVQLAR
jgi:hypothetical protein